MSSQQLDEERIFHIARVIPTPDARSEYLDQVCSGDAALRERVEELLKVHERELEFLKSSPEAKPTSDFSSATEAPGQQIGRFRLLQKIGEGGFGVVYMAEQTRPVRRKVAFKVIKPGMDTGAVVARFEAERQALAMMDHPNIARVLDGGATDSGRPYFVMELVRGVPVTEYCDKNQLSTQDRLKLFIKVCQAVQHAHQKGIIHRDLKPSNILVTLHDGQPVIKVIDFGVAKAINQQLTEKTLFTAYGQMVGTPQYMSPEQAEMSGLDVDTRSDIYSLGVLLYELLTGTTPLEAEQLRTAGFAEMQRLIREQEPPKPSTRLSSTGDALTVIAKHRSATPERLQRLVKGDLDWIVMRSLEKDRGRRYPTAISFAEDITRTLNDRAVEASPPAISYRIRKYLRRNRHLVAAAATVGTALLLGIVGLSVGLRQAIVVQGELQQAKDDLEQRNRELSSSLDRWSDELFQRAMTAAVLVDEEALDSIIGELKQVGIGPAWEAKARGLLALHKGEINAALGILDQAVQSAPEDAGAAALIAKANLESGEYDEYLQWKSRLNELHPTTDEDTLLVAHALIYSDLVLGEAMMRDLVQRNPTPLGLAIHSEALWKLHERIEDETLQKEADLRLAAAKLMMPDNSLVALMEFYTHFSAALNGDKSKARHDKLSEAFAELAKYKRQPVARHARASYHDYLGATAKAHSEWEQMRESAAGAWYIYYAASMYRTGAPDRAIQILSHVSGQFLTDYYLAEACALEPEPAKRSAARRIYGELLKRSDQVGTGPNEVVGFPETILLLMGHGDEAREAAATRLEIRNLKGWNREIVQFIANADSHPKTLISKAKTRTDLCLAHKVIAARYLSVGDISKALLHSRECKQAFPMDPAAYWADAIRARLESDEAATWRHWLEERRLSTSLE